MKQIEEWSSTTFKEVIFDSDVDKWSQNTSVFGERVFEKQQLTFIIEDNGGNVFGGFVNQKIRFYRYLENGEWKGGTVRDPHTFTFSLESNGRLEQPTKFTIKSDE